MNNIYFGTFVPAGLKSQHLPSDTHLSKVNRDIKKIFKKNGLVEGRTTTWKDKLRQLMV
jgi:hypothetical protein